MLKTCPKTLPDGLVIKFVPLLRFCTLADDACRYKTFKIFQKTPLDGRAIKCVPLLCHTFANDVG